MFVLSCTLSAILLGFVVDLVSRKREQNFMSSQTVITFNFLQLNAMAVWSGMRPLAIAIRKLNIVL